METTKIDMPDLLEFFNLKKFEAEFFDALHKNERSLPLLDYCSQGGSPAFDGDVEFSDLDYDYQGDGIVCGTFHISFKETYYNGCRDIEWTQAHSGTMDFSLNLKKDELEITDA